MSAKGTSKQVNIYTREFKQSSAKLAVTAEQPVTHTAVELGVNVNTLHGWVKKYYPDKVKSSHSDISPSENSAEELKRLRKENARLRQERDILKKATAYFAGEMM